MKNGHARLSPSGAEGWMTCAGKPAMEDALPGETSEYADEGTAAHALAAMCVVEDKHATAYFGRVLKIVNGKYYHNPAQPKPEKLFGREKEPDIEREFEVNAEMIAAVNVYLQSIAGYIAADGTGHAVAYTEVELPIGHVTGEDDATGTGDKIIITGDGFEIQAHDLKYGMGVRVYATKNKQLMLYGLGAIKKFPGKYKTFRAVIHQPRISDKPDEWSCTIEELEAFADEAHAAAKNAGIAFTFKDNWLGKPDGMQYLVVSEKGCMWCKAAATCPARDKHVQDTVGAAFEVIADIPKGVEVAKLIPTDITALGLKLKACDLIEDWVKAVRGRVESTLFENFNTLDAQTALGFKLVEGKRGNRKYDDEGAVEQLFKKQWRLKDDVIYTRKLITPTQACDVLLKDQPKRLELLATHIKQAPGKPSVAPLHDKREALVLKPTVDAFAVETEDETGGLG